MRRRQDDVTWMPGHGLPCENAGTLDERWAITLRTPPVTDTPTRINLYRDDALLRRAAALPITVRCAPPSPVEA
ncbi:unnamed protein product [Bubo scandiacus]